jgi:CBS domain-containing protein
VNLDARLDAAVVGIERHLTDTYPARPGTRFNFNDAASAAHRDGRLSDSELADVRSLWEVRNLVSHRRFDGQRPVAATTAGVVLAEQLLEVLSGKLARLDMFAGKAGGVATIAPDAPVRAALELMQMNDFTCLPVVDRTGFQGLISSHDLVCWLGARLGEVGLVADEPVGPIARHGGVDSRFVSRDLPQRDARQLFLTHTDEHGQPLAALLITKTGTAHESLLGILTAWDPPALTPSIAGPADC